MKKFAALLLLPVCLLLCACTQETANTAKLSSQEEYSASVNTAGEVKTQLSPEKETEIKQAYRSAYQPSAASKDIEIHSFWGEYNGSYVVYINGSVCDVIAEDKIEDIVFVYPTSAKALVYREGNFYGLFEAYEAGFLTLSDMKTAYQLYLICGPYRHAVLSPEKQLGIKQAFINTLSFGNELMVEDVTISELFGVYNGAYVMFLDAGLVYTDAFTYDSVGDLVFPFPSSHQIAVYYEGTLYSRLSEAYEAGHLTDEDARIIYGIYLSSRPNLKS